MVAQDKGSSIKEALRQGFRNGTSKIAGRNCYGYNRTETGALVINFVESKVVQWIFESYFDGRSLAVKRIIIWK